MTKATWVGRDIFGLHIWNHSSLRTEGSQCGISNCPGTWRQELMRGVWRSAAYWLATYGLLSLHSYRTQAYQPRDGTTPHELGPPHQSVLREVLKTESTLLAARH